MPGGVWKASHPLFYLILTTNGSTSLFCRGGNWDLERKSKMSEVAQLVSESWVWTHVLWPQRPPYLTTTLHYRGSHTEDPLECRADVCLCESSLPLGWPTVLVSLGLSQFYHQKSLPGTCLSPQANWGSWSPVLLVQICFSFGHGEACYSCPRDWCLPDTWVLWRPYWRGSVVRSPQDSLECTFQPS